MELFENTWRSGYEFYERYFDTNLNKSVSRKIDLPYEWYEPSSTGLYTYILDETIKLEKKQGHAKQGRDQYGFLDPMYRNIRDNYWRKDAYNQDPRIWYLDIETRVGTCSTGFPVPEKAAEPISLMQIFDSQTNAMIVLGVREWKHQSSYDLPYPVKYVQCRDEIHLIETYISLFKRCDPLILYAWNASGVNGFDYPYIYNRMKKLGMDPNQMSNYGDCKLVQGEYKGQVDWKFEADGHYYIDLQNVYKTFVKAPRPGYSLDAIAEVELRENKVDHSEYSTFDGFYTGDYNIPHDPTEEQKNSQIYKEAIAGNWDEVRELAHSDFVYYGVTDTYLVKRIDDKLKFTSLMFMIADKMGVLFHDVLGTVKPWAQYILNTSHANMKITPPKQDHDNPNIVGGYVRDPNAGKHKWVLSADVNSMYPLLGMVGFNMSPETFVPKSKLPNDLKEYVLRYFNDQEEDRRFDIPKEEWERIIDVLEKHNMALGINGAVFSKEELGMIPEMVLEIYYSRKKAKGTMFKYEDQKILIKKIMHERGLV